MGANLKEVRDRIKSVISTQQITKAMKMVSAAKLRRAQMAIVSMRPYSKKMNSMLSNIVSNMGGSIDISYAKSREVVHPMIVLVTSNRGLCGAFNSYIIKEAVKLIDGKYKSQYEAGNLSMIFVGKRGFEFVKKRYPKLNIIEDHVNLFADLSFDNTEKVAQYVMDQFDSGAIDAIDVAYGEFKNAGVQYYKVEQFLPVAKVEVEEVSEKTRSVDFVMEPTKEELLEEMFPSILKMQFHKFLLDTHASEHGARMTAMDKATENADDLLKELRINYNKARQEAITNEISEIVGGAAALEGA